MSNEEVKYPKVEEKEKILTYAELLEHYKKTQKDQIVKQDVNVNVNIGDKIEQKLGGGLDLIKQGSNKIITELQRKIAQKSINGLGKAPKLDLYKCEDVEKMLFESAENGENMIYVEDCKIDDDELLKLQKKIPEIQIKPYEEGSSKCCTAFKNVLDIGWIEISFPVTFNTKVI